MTRLKSITKRIALCELGTEELNSPMQLMPCEEEADRHQCHVSGLVYEAISI